MFVCFDVSTPWPSQTIDPSAPHFVPPKKPQKICMHVCHFTKFGLTKQKLLKFKLYSYLEISFLNGVFFTWTFEIKLNSIKKNWDEWFYSWGLIYLGQPHKDPLMLFEVMSKAKELYLWNVNITKWHFLYNNLLGILFVIWQFKVHIGLIH